MKNPAFDLPNAVMITAVGANEIATRDQAHQHGLLTYYLLQAFRGEAADEPGQVTVERLEQYLKEKVSQLAEELRNRKQTPQVLAASSTEVLARLADPGA